MKPDVDAPDVGDVVGHCNASATKQFSCFLEM